MGSRSLDHYISHSSALLLSKRNSTMGKAIIRFMCDRRSAYCKAQQYQRTACVYRIRKKWIESNSKVDTNDIRKHCTGYRRGHGFKSRTGLNFLRPYFHYGLSRVHYCEDHFQIHDDTRVEQCLLYVLTWAGSLIGIQDTTTRTSTLETADSVNTLMLTNALKLLTFIHVYREIVY